ncbi:MAG TPA: DUF4364 family protein [Clostridiales bacterium]|nr:DUF4364 family protein [Clostridiales bacterium]HPP36631.1 DUF4364 family protein [Clostridiales bacterium]
MNPLGSSKEIVQNKLIIMYILQKLDMPVSNNALTKLILEMHLMNYFVLQQCLNELCESNMASLVKDAPGTKNASERSLYEANASGLSAATDAPAAHDNRPEGSSGSYILTDAGRKTLQYLITKIPSGIRKRLDNTIPAARKEIEKDLLITAEYIPESEDKYLVICKMRERDFPLIELRATVGTKKDALSVCDNWKKHSSAIYSEIIESLTKDRSPDH